MSSRMNLSEIWDTLSIRAFLTRLKWLLTLSWRWEGLFYSRLKILFAVPCDARMDHMDGSMGGWVVNPWPNWVTVCQKVSPLFVFLRAGPCAAARKEEQLGGIFQRYSTEQDREWKGDDKKEIIGSFWSCVTSPLWRVRREWDGGLMSKTSIVKGYHPIYTDTRITIESFPRTHKFQVETPIWRFLPLLAVRIQIEISERILVHGTLED